MVLSCSLRTYAASVRFSECRDVRLFLCKYQLLLSSDKSYPHQGAFILISDIIMSSRTPPLYLFSFFFLFFSFLYFLFLYFSTCTLLHCRLYEDKSKPLVQCFSLKKFCWSLFLYFQRKLFSSNRNIQLAEKVGSAVVFEEKYVLSNLDLELSSHWINASLSKSFAGVHSYIFNGSYFWATEILGNACYPCRRYADKIESNQNLVQLSEEVGSAVWMHVLSNLKG